MNLNKTVVVNKDAKPESDILAVIVTYNAVIEGLKDTIGALYDQACRVLVVDNASSNQVEVAKCVSDFSRDTEKAFVGTSNVNASQRSITFIGNTENLGLGAAHNQGLVKAKEQGCDYLLILDQDSVPQPGMVAQLLRAHQRLSQTQKVSAVGACYLNSQNQSESFFVRFGALKFQREYANRELVQADFLISSGSLFSLETLNTVGGMDEGLFIDHVDTEWFLRAKSQGFTAYGVSAARMQHSLGEDTHRLRLGGRQRNIPQHKPFRYYYIFRNSIVLYRRNYTSWLWKWNDIQRLGMIFIMFGLVKPPRWQNMKMMLLGSWHGMTGKIGQINVDSSRG